MKDKQKQGGKDVLFGWIELGEKRSGENPHNSFGKVKINVERNKVNYAKEFCTIIIKTNLTKKLNFCCNIFLNKMQFHL